MAPAPSDRLPISAFIICLNEEDRIERAIASVMDWVDEVIVIDSGSHDKTVALAEALGARVLHNDWPGYGAQKRFGEEQCRNEWLLNLDADEEVSPELAAEIRAVFNAEPQADIFRIHIADVFAHEDAPASWAYAYWQYRLYKKSAGRFSASSVHDTVRLNPEARLQDLKAPMYHRSVRSISWSVFKMNRYSDMQVADMAERQRTLSPWRMVFEFPLAFLKSYLLRQNFRYGFWGLVVAHNYAYSRFLRVAKCHEQALLAQKQMRDATQERTQNEI